MDVIFTYLEESDFFIKSKYEFIKHDFNFKALGNLTSNDFAEKIEDEISTLYIKKFAYQEGDHHYFLEFYAEDGIGEGRFLVIHAYHNKKEYFSINKIDYRTFQRLDLEISINHIPNEVNK
ncbi:hypothetical protein [Bacillus sp. RO1]|uniref:hypothetical protein n=1 Tax=Bacillus sp. RO1 TaxID=2722703 RepID=UPI00145699AB|nr:hypothetical protein [Bacillus sp. RO1]NLP52055.1 hypothetical protein [Bacillus sp. RO1]